jgi:hypothetical protein
MRTATKGWGIWLKSGVELMHAAESANGDHGHHRHHIRVTRHRNRCPNRMTEILVNRMMHGSQGSGELHV